MSALGLATSNFSTESEVIVKVLSKKSRLILIALLASPWSRSRQMIFNENASACEVIQDRLDELHNDETAIAEERNIDQLIQNLDNN